MDTDTDTDILADFRARIVARMSVGDARVYTCKRVLYTITMVYTFTKLYYRRIPNFGVGVRVGPMEFQLYHTTTDPNLIHTARHDTTRLDGVGRCATNRRQSARD